MIFAAPWRQAPEAEFAVIGHPVGHSRSPQMHHAAYRALGLPHRYVALEVLPGEVAAALDFLAEKGYRGVNVTVPHKAEALAWAKATHSSAVRAGGANTVSLTDHTAYSTDGPGFLLAYETSLDDGAVLILGAGGSARAVAVALVDSGRRVRLWNRTPERAQELAEHVGGIEVATEPDPAGIGVVVNATSASLQGDAVPVIWAHLSPEAIAIDLMYADRPTPFLVEGTRAGARECLDGRAMLAGQGALAFEIWLGQRPFEVMLDALGR